jgi:hypothetical protein
VIFPGTRFGGRISWVAVAFVLALIPSLVTAQVQPQEEGVQILFIHHSCGGQLLADTGVKSMPGSMPSSQCIYVSHPNGGDLRILLEAEGFEVNEAFRGSQVGEDTDIHHWHTKFRDQMDQILVTRRQDELLSTGQSNRIVVFKSCYPNNRFVGEGHEPGDPDSPELTVANAKAAYRSLLPFFRAHPEVLYVPMTAPPLAEPRPVGIRATIKSWFSKAPEDAALARRFNTWLVDAESGWLAEYDGDNVAVFDHYNVLTNDGATDWSAYPTREGKDSHPSAAGNTKSAAAFVAFLMDVLPTGGSLESP